MNEPSTRRRLLFGLGASAAAGVLGAGAGALVRGRRRDADAPARDQASACVEVDDPPAEDFMREHAVLERVLLVYEECAHLLETGEKAPPLDVIAGAAGLVRRYIEDHHERDEEEHVFPRLKSVGAEVALVDTLLVQHAAGRRLTGEILTLARGSAGSDRPRLAASLRRFSRMYRPHAARESTVLFPALRRAVSREEYARLEATLERNERRIFGAGLYERVLGEVADLERAVGVDDLAAFTPPAGA